MTDVERKISDRIEQLAPNRVETYSDAWADAARLAYPEYQYGQKTPESLVAFSSISKAEQVKLPGLEIVSDVLVPQVDPTLVKVEQIATQLKSEKFGEREKGSKALRDILRTELAGKKLTPALEKIFQLVGSEDAEVRSRVLAALKPAITETVNAKDLSLLKLFLSCKESPVRDFAIEKVQESPNELDIVAKLAAMTQTESAPDFVEAVRRMAKAVCTKRVIDDFHNNVQGPITDKLYKNIFDAYGQNIAQLNQDQRTEAIKTILGQFKTSVNEADEVQKSDVAVMARVLYTPQKSEPFGEGVDDVQAHPFRSRLSVGGALFVLAKQLKDANKDPAAVDLLQATAISYYKESLLMAPDSKYRNAVQTYWGLLDGFEDLRKLNPSQFDSLVPDKLLPRPLTKP